VKRSSAPERMRIFPELILHGRRACERERERWAERQRQRDRDGDRDTERDMAEREMREGDGVGRRLW
jgi:hypothetical protein